MALSALIVDDEVMARYILRSSIEEYCPEISEIKEADTVDKALEIIRTEQPPVLFVDIRMPQRDGFDLLEKVYGNELFYVIFVTAYDEYALKALKGGVFDYLLKPISHIELKEVVNKLYRDYLKKSAKIPAAYLDGSLSIRHTNGFSILKLKEISYMEASNNYTFIHLGNGNKMVVSKTLKEIHEKLDSNVFIRVHKSFAVNIFHLKGYLHKDGGNFIQMQNGASVPVTRYTMNQLETQISAFSQRL